MGSNEVQIMGSIVTKKKHQKLQNTWRKAENTEQSCPWFVCTRSFIDPKWSLVKDCRQIRAGRAWAEQPKGCAELAPPGAEKMSQGNFQSSQTQICCKVRLKGKFQCQNPPVTGIWEVSSGRGFAADSMFRWLKCQKLLEVILKHFCDSQLHNWFPPICRSFLTLVCKELCCWKCLQSSLSFTGVVFHL